MALQIADRVKERIQNNVGTGSLTLLGAPTGFQTFSSAISVSDTTYYCVEGPNGAFEIGVGTLLSSTSFGRTTVLRSSNGGAALNIGSGQYFLFISYIADKAVYRNIANEVVVPSEGFRFSDNTTQITSPTAAIALKADIASPTFTGTPSGPTATVGSNTTQLATTSFVSSAIAAVDLSVYVQKTSATGSLILPSGTTAQRDGSPAAGYSRWNTTTSRFERWTGSVWENYVRLSGDTMTGALSLGSNALTAGALKLGDTSASGMIKQGTSTEAGNVPGIVVRDATDAGYMSLHARRVTASDGLLGCWNGSEWNGWVIYSDILAARSTGRIAWSNTSSSLGGAEDLKMIRVSAGLASVCGNAGLKIQNFAGSADAALTCGNLTASGTSTFASEVILNGGTVINSSSYQYKHLGTGIASFLLNSAGNYGKIQNDGAGKFSLAYHASGGVTLGTPVITWVDTGRVGINNSSPTVALDVNGAITASGTVTASVAQGSSGLVHRTNSYDVLGTIYDGSVMWIKEMPGFVPLGLGTQSGMSILLSPGSTKVQQRDGANAQCYQLHETYTSGSDRAWLDFKATGSAYEISSAIGSAGGSNRPINLGHRNSAGTFTSALSVATSGTVSVDALYLMGGSPSQVGTANRLTFSSGAAYIFYRGNTGNSFTVDPVSGGTAAFGGPITCGAITASGNVNIGANSIVGTYSGIFNDGKWLTGSDGYSSFYISPFNAGFAFLPPAAGNIQTHISYTGVISTNTGVGLGTVNPATTDVRYYRNATGPKASIRAAGGLEVQNLDGSADAAITCGAITASGTIQASPSTSKAMQFTRSATNYSFEVGSTDDSLGWYDIHNGRYVFRSTTSNFLINETGALRTLINTGTDDGVNTLQVAGSSAFAGNLTLSDTNLITGTATGTIIATANSQKLGFWGATPIVQPTTAVAAATLVSNAGTTLTDTDTFDGYTLKQIVKALRIAGLLA